MNRRMSYAGRGSYLCTYFLACALVLPHLALSQNSALQLTLDSVSGKNIRLRASAAGVGAATDPLNLEASYDLESWFHLESRAADPATGSASFEHAQEWPADAVYYRLRAGAPPAEVRVAPTLNTNLTATGLIGREFGTRLELTTAQGIRFTFDAPSNLVADPVPVRMTVISNFTAFPGSGGWQAAVALEPDGLEFRRPATLRITFPSAVHSGDLYAYSFAGDGTAFRLLELGGSSNTVVVPVNSFSGKGVGTFPNGAPPTFDKAWQRSQDARHAAEDRAARRQNQIIRDEYSNRISEAESAARQRSNRLRSLEEIYRDSIRPYESAAGADCAIGRAIVLFELERLANQWGAETGEDPEASPFWKRIMALIPGVRCRCAQALIDRCEKEAGVSGSALLHSMRDLLEDSRIITGRTDAQGCYLGSDEEILATLQNGPCFGDWEGTVTLTRLQTTLGEKQEGFRKFNWDDEQREVYYADVKGIQSERSFTVGGRKVQSWLLDTVGTYAASSRIKQTQVHDDPNSDVIQTTTISRDAANTPRAEGTISLRFENGAFNTLGIGGGTESAGPDSNLKHTTTTTTSYECKPSYPENRECPAETSFSIDSNFRLFMGFSLGLDSVPPVDVTLTPRSFRLTWRREYDLPSTVSPPTAVEERIVVDLVRKAAP